MIIKCLKRISSLLTLLLINACAYASSSTSAADKLFNVSAVINKTDASITYLGQLFGQVGTVLVSTSTGFVGHMFNIYNQGVLVLAGVWILYTIYNTIVKMSDKGAEQKLTGLGMKFIKIAVGISLVMPSGTTGYSLVQDFTMWVVGEGIALADATWNSALDYLAEGGSVLGALSYSYQASTVSSLASLSTGNGYFGPSNSSTSSSLAKVLAMQVCAIHNYGNWTQTQKLTTNTLYTIKNSGAINFNSSNCGGISRAPLTGLSGASSSLTQSTIEDLLSNMKSAADYYACALHPGSSYSSYCSLIGVSSTSTGISTTVFNNYLANAYISYVSSLSTLSTNATEGGGSTSSSTTSSCTGGISSSSSVNSQLSCLASVMKASGWINTGAYYWAIAGWMQNNGLYGSLLSSSDSQAALMMISNVSIATTNPPSASTYLSDYSKNVTATTSLSTIISNYSNALTTETSSTSTSSETETTDLECTGDDACNNIIVQALWTPLLEIYTSLEVNLVSLTVSSPSDDPLVILSVIGFNMINEASTLIAIALSLIVLMAVLAIVGAIVFVLADPIGFVFPILNVIINIVKGIALYLLGIGGMLAIYLPVYPWMMWVFAVIGWFITVIEAMAAAPLVCLGLTRPEGQELAGELKQGLMLLLSVFLRPVLMVIGFCTAIVLSRIILYFVIHTFAIISLNLLVTGSDDITTAINSLATLDTSNPNYVQDSLQLTQTLANSFASAVGKDNTSFAAFIFEIIATPTVFAILGYMAYKVITFSFTLVFYLPTYVMKWIGSPAAGDGMTQQLMGAADQGKSAAQAGTKIGTSTASGGMGATAALGGMVTDAASSASGAKAAKQEESEENNSAKSGGGGGGGGASAGGSGGGAPAGGGGSGI